MSARELDQFHTRHVRKSVADVNHIVEIYASFVFGLGGVDVDVVADVQNAFVYAVDELCFVGVVNRHFCPDRLAVLIQKFACKYLFEVLCDARTVDDLFKT